MRSCLFFLDDQETHSSDEMLNLKDRIHCNKLKKSLSGSLPSIVADTCKLNLEFFVWENFFLIIKL